MATPTREGMVYPGRMQILALSSLLLPVPGGEQVFVEVGSARGIGDYQQAPGLSAGVAAEDFDGDGFVDLFVPTACGGPDLLYRNLGTGSFEEVGAQLGLDSLDNHRGALWLDVDGDGDLDLLVGGDEYGDLECGDQSSLVLYRQTAAGRFEDITAAAGLEGSLSVAPDSHMGGMAAGDLDRDGDLDLVVCIWEGYAHIFINDGSGSFEERGAQLGIRDWRAHWQPVIHDFDRDSWPDIFQAVDFQANELWMSRGGLGFVDRAPEAGIDFAFNEMGVALGDPDSDGDFDLYVTNLHGPGEWSTFFRREGAGLTFTEIAQDLGVDDGGCGWGAVFLDADCSGWLDLASTNACNGDASRFFRGVGGGAFQEVSSQVGYDDTLLGSGLVALDIERDGDLDLVQACALGQPLLLYENRIVNGPDDRSWLVVQPRLESGAPAVGAVVRVGTPDGHRQARTILAGSSILSQNPGEAHFGMGDFDSARVLVSWPDGRTSNLGVQPCGQVLRVRP